MTQRQYPMIYSAPMSLVNHNHEKGFFEGYASTFSVDLQGDKIEKGAFKKTIKDWMGEKRWPHIYWEHNIRDVIGVCLDMKTDDKGLWIKGKLLMDIPRAREVYRLFRCGLRGFSIGFVPTQSFIKKGIRHITSLSLEEISIVHCPCNNEAQIAEYKSHSKEHYTEWIRNLAQKIRFL